MGPAFFAAAHDISFLFLLTKGFLRHDDRQQGLDSHRPLLQQRRKELDEKQR